MEWCNPTGETERQLITNNICNNKHYYICGVRKQKHIENSQPIIIPQWISFSYVLQILARK